MRGRTLAPRLSVKLWTGQYFRCPSKYVSYQPDLEIKGHRVKCLCEDKHAIVLISLPDFQDDHAVCYSTGAANFW